ncbi:MAG TPA: SDR family oxidoreductase [Candidatus Thermoplasmatota archaeon]|nr:SDR family oxidoreductase [Candidatus Thermoplasmatota archaeon]
MAKTVLVTGAGRGIGLAAAEAFERAGWNVVATARDQAALDRLAARGWTAIPLDIEQASATAEAARRALEAGPPSVLVNNAGYAELGPVETVDRSRWRRQFETNVFGPFDLARRLLPAMRAMGGGRVIQMSSALGRQSAPWAGVYAASKFALEAATDAFRVEVRPWNVGVTLVEPGFVRGDFVDAAVAGMDASLEPGNPYDRSRRNLDPWLARVHRFAVTPERVAAVILREATRPRPRARAVVGFAARASLVARALAPGSLVDLVMHRVLSR